MGIVAGYNASLRGKIRRKTANRCWIRVDLSEKPDLSLPAILGDRNSVAHLGGIQSNENFAILLGIVTLTVKR
jgi:hypothetical protein